MVFLYLAAIMHWHSRKVLTWRVSNTMASDFCVFIERLWRTLEYENIYLNPAESGNAYRDGITEFLI
jgi:transposase InsO family protein